MKKTLSLVNEKHKTVYQLRVDGLPWELSRAAVRRIRAHLCPTPARCRSCGILGEFGAQPVVILPGKRRGWLRLDDREEMEWETKTGRYGQYSTLGRGHR